MSRRRSAARALRWSAGAFDRPAGFCDHVGMDRTERIRAVRRRLSAWWGRHKRDLPWRRRRDAYAIWVSEVMLQQTRVETVRGYYERFLKRWPDAASLAAAHLDDVLKAWEGMGYYSRARNLHRAAKIIAGAHGGKLPRAIAELRKLPGVGAYTAGAIASIAYGLDEPVVDGNVVRVLCRAFVVRGDPRRSRVRRRLWTLARELIPPGRAGVFNQALMDLGATVCVPRRPRCTACPLRAACGAFARGRQEQLPRRAARKALPHHDIAAGVIRKRGRILIDRRQDEGLLGGLWEFPGGKVEAGESPREALRREVREELAVEVRVGPKIAEVEHAYTHFRITLYVFECRHVSGRPKAIGCAAWKWVRPDQLDDYAFPAANRKVIEQLRGGRGT